MLYWIAKVSLSPSLFLMQAPTSPQVECCMCGDYGLLNQLFQCTHCLFRSQHRYCSNLFPKATSFQVCNWCLKKDQENTEATTITSSISSSSSSSSCNNIIKHVALDKPIKKARSADNSFRRSKINSCEMGNEDVKKHLFKTKVRKYKLLEDVCR